MQSAGVGWPHLVVSNPNFASIVYDSNGRMLDIHMNICCRGVQNVDAVIAAGRCLPVFRATFI